MPSRRLLQRMLESDHQSNLTLNPARRERRDAAFVSKMLQGASDSGAACRAARTVGSGRLTLRRFRRLQPAAVGPAIQVFDDLLMARTQRLWRVGLLGKCTWQLETVGHGKSSLWIGLSLHPNRKITPKLLFLL